MSVVIACGYLEEVIILCDSRVSYGGEKITDSKDNLRKIYQLGPMLAVGFTSNDVEFTLELLRRVTLYATQKAKSKATLYLMDKLPKVARYNYNQMAKASGKTPGMEFVYAGMVKDRYTYVKQNTIFDLMKPGSSGAMPEKIGRALMRNSSAEYLALEPPSPILGNQVFPGGNLPETIGLGFITSGSGSGVFDDIMEENSNLFFTDASFPMRIYILRMICEEYIKKAKIPTIGGSIQTLRINAQGVSSMGYFRGHVDANGNQVITEKISFQKGEWVVEDIINNRVTKIIQNPLKLEGSANLKYEKLR